ncbi:MAG TPA: ParB N-terminal domain-containing protein [Kiritimatiellia bacterium]|nr:ParB N-terminal domain-containing protein [Kiritimatiellia bacterium]HMO98933.1 ParB N-terminal domain-containing protein [Kiritimatiellia bacterium]HMP95734.1 ParB N-terminal domain-containing protein [Kiritimatiellia bacterium]
MLTTKRYDYVPIEAIQEHPHIANHRPLNRAKVNHYAEDILKNGLLEPLVVWERNHGEFFLVGGFHRLNAIRHIRQANPGYFDRIDVRVVAGEVDEMRALNLKLNADRLDARVSEYFDTVIYLNNANWEKAKLAAFFDRSESWIEEIIRFVPGMDPRLRKLLDADKVTWTKAKQLCRQILEAPPGQEKLVADRLIAEIITGIPAARPPRPLTLSKATRKLTKHIERNPDQRYVVEGRDLVSLFMVLSGKESEDGHLARVRKAFPALLED